MASHSPVVLGYKYRMKRSQRYFEGLRMLPQWGGAYFEPYFRRTFEAYTTLWRYLQTHRAELEQPEGYNMQRCEIGEIASKIGQLFYFYYLRTSDLTALHESFTFYEAIRVRQYFKTAIPLQTPSILHKKLRYYARYVVLALLKNYRALVWTLLGELSQVMEDMKEWDSLHESTEWTAALKELRTFLKADQLAWLDASPPFSATPMPTFPNSALRTITGCSYRLTPSQALGDSFWKLWHTKHLMRTNSPEALKLTEAVLVSTKTIQVKFSELALDTLRMVQSLEWEPGTRSAERLSNAISTVPKPGRDMNHTVDNGFDVGEMEEDQRSKRDTPPFEVARSAPATSSLVFTSNFEPHRSPPDMDSHPPRHVLTPSGSLLNSGWSTARYTGEGYNPNPRKALLYHPTYSQLSYVLSTAMLEMETRSMEMTQGRSSVREALLIFLSGDAVERNVPSRYASASGPDIASEVPTTTHSQPIPLQPSSSSPFKPLPIASTTSHAIFPSSLECITPSPATPNSALDTTPPSSRASQAPVHEGDKDRNSFYLEDLLPFTRNPCFLIVDSESPTVFCPHQNLFHQPLVCLMAPEHSPTEFCDLSTQGSIFTLFLTHPIMAFWSIHQKPQLTQAMHQHATARLHACFAEDLLPMLMNASLDSSYDMFLTNDFTRLYILRFIFCKAALMVHSLFNDPAMLPTCYPELPRHLFTAPSLERVIEDLQVICDS